jgi:adenosine deaminase
VSRDLRQLPKAHLHIHLEGAMRFATLAELVARYRMTPPPDTRGQHFDNFGGFVATYFAACDCIQSRDDLARLIMEVALDAAEQGVWWIELAFDGDRYSIMRGDQPAPLFASPEETWRFALQAAQQAGRATGVGIGFVSAVDRTQGTDAALARAQLTRQLSDAGDDVFALNTRHYQGEHAAIVAFGLHGNEEGFPPEPFAQSFHLATHESTLISTPHAGEIAPFPGGGAASVEGAITALGARRIAHGVLAASDPELVARLAREQVCLDVCPSSNLLLNVYPNVAEHPLPRLIEAGVPCSLASDDPLLFGPDLVDEFELCRHEMKLDDRCLADLARNSFQFSGAPLALKRAGIEAVDEWLRAMP